MLILNPVVQWHSIFSLLIYYLFTTTKHKVDIIIKDIEAEYCNVEIVTFAGSIIQHLYI